MLAKIIMIFQEENFEIDEKFVTMRPFLDKYHLLINKIEDLAHTPHIKHRL